VTLIEISTGRYPYKKEATVFAMLCHIVNGKSPSKSLHAFKAAFCSRKSPLHAGLSVVDDSDSWGLSLPFTAFINRW